MKRQMYNCVGAMSLLAYVWASCVLPMLHVHMHHQVAAVQSLQEHDQSGHQHHVHQHHAHRQHDDHRQHDAHRHHNTEQQAPAAPQPAPCDHHDSECLICQHAAAKILAKAAFACDCTLEKVHLIAVEAITLPDAPSLYSPLQRGPPLCA